MIHLDEFLVGIALVESGSNYFLFDDERHFSLVMQVFVCVFYDYHISGLHETWCYCNRHTGQLHFLKESIIIPELKWIEIRLLLTNAACNRSFMAPIMQSCRLVWLKTYCLLSFIHHEPLNLLFIQILNYLLGNLTWKVW